MSASNIPAKLSSVERLIQRVVVAERGNQREIRMTVSEARDLIADLTVLTTKMADIIVGIHARLDKLAAAPVDVKIETDGGAF